MPEVVVKYKNKKSLAALEDLSKYLDFQIVQKEATTAHKKTKMLKSIKQSLKEVKLIESGKLKPKTAQQFLNEL